MTDDPSRRPYHIRVASNHITCCPETVGDLWPVLQDRFSSQTFVFTIKPILTEQRCSRILTPPLFCIQSEFHGWRMQRWIFFFFCKHFGDASLSCVHMFGCLCVLLLVCSHVQVFRCLCVLLFVCSCVAHVAALFQTCTWSSVWTPVLLFVLFFLSSLLCTALAETLNSCLIFSKCESSTNQIKEESGESGAAPERDAECIQ